MLKHLKKLSEEIVHKNPWWTYKHETYEKPNGEVGDYYYAETNGMVMIIPVMADGRIAMVVEYRYLEDRQSIEFPGGGIRPGVEPLDAVKEELLEETGLIADEFTKLGAFQPASGFVKDLSHVYIAQVSEQKEQKLQDTEQIEVIYRRPDEIENMIRNNDIWCGQTLAAWAMARNFFTMEKPEASAPGLKAILDYFS